MITTKLNPNSIPSSAITTDKISNKSVTYEKLSDEVKNMFESGSNGGNEGTDITDIEIEYCEPETTLRENCVFIFDDEKNDSLDVKIEWYEDADGGYSEHYKIGYPYTFLIKHYDSPGYKKIRLIGAYDVWHEIEWSDKNIIGTTENNVDWIGYYKIDNYSVPYQGKVSYTEVKIINLGRTHWFGKVTHYFTPYYDYNEDVCPENCPDYSSPCYEESGCASESTCSDCTTFNCPEESGYNCPNESGYNCPNESGYNCQTYCPNESGYDSSCPSDNCGGTDYDGDGCLGEYFTDGMCEIDNCGGIDYDGDGCETENGCEDNGFCSNDACISDGSCECFGVVTCDEEGCDIYY